MALKVCVTAIRSKTNANLLLLSLILLQVHDLFLYHVCWPGQDAPVQMSSPSTSPWGVTPIPAHQPQQTDSPKRLGLERMSWPSKPIICKSKLPHKQGKTRNNKTKAVFGSTAALQKEMMKVNWFRSKWHYRTQTKLFSPQLTLLPSFWSSQKHNEIFRVFKRSKHLSKERAVESQNAEVRKEL